MAYQPDIYALSLNDHKLSALYFNRVFPVQRQIDPFAIPENALLEMGLDQMGWMQFHVYLMKSVYAKQEASLSKIPQTRFDELLDSGRLDGEDAQDILNAESGFNRDHELIKLVSNNLDFPTTPVFNEGAEYQYYRDLPKTGTVSAVEIIVNNAPVIDTSEVQWDQILEVRRDVEMMRKLRNMRLFIYEKYDG